MLAAVGCCAADLPVVNDGKAVAEIVVHSPGLEFAASELQKYVGKISGAQLPISTIVDPEKPQIVLTTAPEVVNQYPADILAWGNTDGYAVRQQGNTVYLFSLDNGGVLRGIYRYLGKNTDIIWARPDETIGTQFTASDTLTFTENDYREVPAFRLRSWQFADPINNIADVNATLAWSVRTGNNFYPYVGCVLPKSDTDPWELLPGMYPFGHNLVGSLIQEKKYLETNPEFFPYIFGHRITPSQEPDFAQLCFTNQAMLAEAKKNFDQLILKRPHAPVFMIGIEDNNNLCYCEKCTEPILLPDGTQLTGEALNFHSTRAALFLNEMARHIKQNCPGKKLLCFAYFFTEFAPAIELEDNIIVLFCPIYKNNKFPLNHPENQIEWDNFKDHVAMGNQIYLYDYHGLSTEFPRAVDRSAAQELLYCWEQGVRFSQSEIYLESLENSNQGSVKPGCWDQNAMYFWIVSQLRWNPKADVNALRDEFLHRTFGAAAEDMKVYFEAFETAWNAGVSVAQYHTAPDETWQSLLKLGLYESCRDALLRARNKELSPGAKQWVERLWNAFENNHYLNVGKKYIEDWQAAQLSVEGRENLVQNSGFELTSDQEYGVEKPDWEKSGFQHWALWVLNPGGFSKCFVARGDGVDGSTAAGASNVYRYCYIQSIPATPGKAYYLRAKVKVVGEIQECVLAVVYENGALVRYSPGKPDADGWREIHALIVPPENCSKFSLQAGTFRHDIHREILWDDIEVYELQAAE